MFDDDISFQDWQGIFLVSLEVGQNYKDFLTKVISWLKSLSNGKPLTLPLDDSSVPMLIEVTLPKIISQILGFGFIQSHDERKLLLKFLKRVIKSLPAIKPYLNSELIKSISSIFNSNEVLYKSNLIENFHSKILDCFINQIDIIEAILNSMISDENFINFYIVILSIFNIILNNRSIPLGIVHIKNYTQLFIQYICQNLHNPRLFQDNFVNLAKAFDCLSEFLIKLDLDEVSTQIKALYELSQKNMSNQFVEIQRFSARCLSTLCQNPKQARVIINEQKKESKSIFDTILSNNIQPEALQQLQPFIQFQIEQGIINLKSLIQLWDACNNSDFLNNNPVCIDIFAFSLKFLDNDSIREFLSAIQLNLSPFYYNVLSKTILELQNFERTIEISIASIRILFDLALVDEAALKILLNLIKNKLNTEISQCLLKETFPLFQKENYSSFACVIVKELINSSSDPVHLFDELSLDTVLENLNEDNKIQIIMVLFQYHIKIGTKPNTRIINELLNSNLHDEAFKFLKQLLKNNNYQNSEDFKELFQLASKEDPESASINFCKFLKILIFKISRNYFIEANGTQPAKNLHAPFNIKCNTIPGLDIMFKLYQFNTDPKTVLKAKKFLLLIFKSWESNSVVNYLNESIQQLILILTNEQKESLNRSLELVYEYLIENEQNSDPEDFNAPRHYYPHNYLHLQICIVSIYANKTYRIHFDQQKTLKNLKERIAERENQMVNSIAFENYQTNQEPLSLFECGITNNSSIKININAYAELTQLHTQYKASPSYLFYSSQFGDVLLNYLDENDQERTNLIIWKILQLLPTCQFVSDMLNKPIQVETEEEDIIENFSNTLSKSANNFKKLYLIQSLSDSSLGVFTHFTLLDNLLKLFVDPFFREDIIYLFNSRYNDEYFEKAQDILNLLIHYIPDINNDDLISVIFELIKKIAKENIFNLTEDCLILFEKLNHTYRKMIIDFIQIVIENHNHNEIIFDFCRSRIVFNQGDFNFGLYLITNLNKYLNSSQVIIIYEFLIDQVEAYCYSIDQKEEQKLIDQNAFDDVEIRTVGDILNCISSILNEFPIFIYKVRLPIDSLFKLAFGPKSNLTQKPIFYILSAHLKKSNDNEFKNSIISKLIEMINYQLERWSYNPAIFARNAPYTGLRNLGATCFLNSTFQQLFHLFPFRYFLSTFQFDHDKQESLEILQKIFIKMAFTSRSYVDTSSFIETWKGWNNSLLNPKEQQDAVEFFLALIDTLPAKITDIFKGEMKNFLSGIDFKFDNSKTETFFNLSISIKNHKDIESSFDEFIQEEQLSDYEIDDENKQKITVRKFLRISKLPTVLVIQLKRFEYNLNTHDRYKINDRFEFPLSLNIKKLCENEEMDESLYLYDLSGIVIHTGVATGGHFLSNIKKGNDWWCLNDTEVSKLNEKVVLNNAFGGKESNSSAYILFYTKSDYFSIEKSKKGEIEHKISFNNEFDYSKEIECLDEIIEDNKIFDNSQALFGVQVIDFVQNIQEPILSLLFFIRVLCRSKNYSKATQFVSAMKDTVTEINSRRQIQEEITVLDNCVELINQHLVDIVNNYMNCSQDSFVFNLTEIILFYFRSLDKVTSRINYLKQTKPNKKCLLFFNNFVEKVLDHVNSYRQLPAMLKLINSYISDYPTDALNNRWIQKLLLILDAVYISQQSKNQNFLNNLNLSDLFIALNSIISNVPKLDFDISKDLLKHAGFIKSSDANKSAYSALILTCVIKNYISISAIKGIVSIDTNKIKNQYFVDLKQLIINPADEMKLAKEDSAVATNDVPEQKADGFDKSMQITITNLNGEGNKVIRIDDKEEAKSNDKEEDKSNDKEEDKSNDNEEDKSNDNEEDKSNDKEEDKSNDKEEDKSNDKEEDKSNDKEEDMQFDDDKEDAKSTDVKEEDMQFDNEKEEATSIDIDKRNLEIEFIKSKIDELIKGELFSEYELSSKFQEEIKKVNEDFINKIVIYSPQIFADKLIKGSNNTKDSYTSFYKILFNVVSKLKNSKENMSYLLHSFEDYLGSIVFDETKIIQYIPTNPSSAYSTYTKDCFFFGNYLDLYKILISETKDFSIERADRIIKIIESFDKAKRIFADYTILQLFQILQCFPAEAFTGQINEILINYFIPRINDAKPEHISREVDQIIKTIHIILKIDNPLNKSLPDGVDDHIIKEFINVLENESLQLFTIKYITNTFQTNSTNSIYSFPQIHPLSDNSRKLFKIYLLFAKISEDVGIITQKMIENIINKFNENKISFEYKIKFFLFTFEIVPDFINESLITYFFNEFIKTINQNSAIVGRNDLDLFCKFLDMISTAKVGDVFDDINIDVKLFISLCTKYQMGAMEVTKKAIKWTYEHCPFVHDNIVEILTEIISQKQSYPSNYSDLAFQYCVETKNANLLIKFFKIAKQKSDKKRCYSTLYKVSSNKSLSKLFTLKNSIENNANDSEKNENSVSKDQPPEANNDKNTEKDQNTENNNRNTTSTTTNDQSQVDDEFDWIAPFLISNWDSFDKEFEETQAIIYFLKHISDKCVISLMEELENRYFYTNSVESKTTISKILLFYLQQRKSIIPEYREKTLFKKEMLEERMIQLGEKFYIQPFLKLLFQC